MTENEKFLTCFEFLENSNYSSRKKNRLTAEMSSALLRGLPAIVNFHHFAAIFSFAPRLLGAMINEPEMFYRSFEIPKKSGGSRFIEAPYPTLLVIQQWLLKNVLQTVQIPDSAHGYVKSRSILSHAKNHVSQDKLLKIDIKKFFPSISSRRIYTIFRNMGYSKSISYIFTKICCKNNELPQGAATSPYLSNIVLLEVDKKLSEVAKEAALEYSRYADDLAFSGPEIPVSFTELITSILKNHGFEVNEDKTQLKSSTSRKILTGIDISNGNMTIPRSKKRKIRQEIYYLSKFGLMNHLTVNNDLDPIYLERLLGRLNFWKFVEPESKYVNDAIATVNKLRKSKLF